MKRLFYLSMVLVPMVFFAQLTQDYKKLAKQSNANYFQIVDDTRGAFNQMNLDDPANKKAKKQFERWSLYWKDRVSEDGTFPSELLGFYNAGILDANGKINENFLIQQNRSANTNSWTNVGPVQSEVDNNFYSNFPQMGRLNVLLRIKHPTNSSQDVLFVGAPVGGIWKSTDGGENWEPKLDQVAGIGVTDIKTVPGTTTENYTSQPIYVSTGDYDGGNVRSIGVLKSTDGGETFVSTGLSHSLAEQKVLGDLIVVDAQTVLVGENRYIKKTTDGGVTWNNIFDSGFASAEIGRMARNGNEVMYTATSGLYYNGDLTNDSNWENLYADNTASIANPDDSSGGDPTSDKSAVTVDDNGDFYIQNELGQVQVFDKSTQSFSNVGNIPVGYSSQQGFNQALLITGGLMITGEVNGQVSTDNGSSWSRLLNGYWNPTQTDQDPTSTFQLTSQGTYIHSDHHRMGKLDGALEFWSVNDGGLSYVNFTSPTDVNPSVTYKSGKVQVLQSYSVAINPNANDGALIASNQDNDAFSNTNNTWYAVAMGDGIQGAINYNNPNIRYAGNQSGLIVQTNTGFVGQLNGNGSTVTVPGAEFYFPFEIHKTNPNILFAGGNEVYKIEDSQTGLNLTNTNSSLGGNVVSIATHGNNVLAATNSAIKLSADGGSTWATIPTSDINGILNSVDFDATNTDILYASVSGYSDETKVYKSINGGNSWTNISGNLPNIVMKEVLLKQGQSEEFLFVATELGVYWTPNPQVDDAGRANSRNATGPSITWNRLGQGLPNVDVRDIDIHYTADKLVAATFGRGLWEIPIPNASLLGTNDVRNPGLEINIFPNPATDKITVSVKSNNLDYVMYNAVGGIVRRGTLTSTNNTIAVSDLPANVYILNLNDGKSTQSEKVIVK